eukprot:7384601-Lingulodinium_polyedra.AAC.1
MAMKLISNMQRGISPDPTNLLTDQFYSRLILRLEWFAEFVPNKDNTVGHAMAQRLRGRKAISAACEAMHAKMNSVEAKEVTLKHLEFFKSFKWMLNGEQLANLSTWTKQVLKLLLGEKAQPDVAEAASSAGKASGSKAKGSAGNDVKKSSVMKFF